MYFKNQPINEIQFPELTTTTDFKAELAPVYMQDSRVHLDDDPGDWLPVQRVKQAQVVIREDTSESLGVVGNGYLPVQNKDLYSILKNSALDVIPHEHLHDIELIEVSSYGGTYTRFELSFPSMKALIKQKNSETELKFRVGISNSFDGSMSIRIFAGAYDLVCENGLITGEFKQAQARHTLGYTSDILDSFIREQMHVYQDVTARFQVWADTPILLPKTIEDTLQAGSSMSKGKVDKIMSRFEVESSRRGRSVWALYSALTYYASHNAGQFKVNDTKDSNGVFADNVGASLELREREVAKIVSSQAWASIAQIHA
jgi:hypothetical protein